MFNFRFRSSARNEATDANRLLSIECSNIIKPSAFFFREVSFVSQFLSIWPAPGSEDTELGVLMEPEVGHGEAEVYTRVQA
jgi:hypothetical protein